MTISFRSETTKGMMTTSQGEMPRRFFLQGVGGNALSWPIAPRDARLMPAPRLPGGGPTTAAVVVEAPGLPPGEPVTGGPEDVPCHPEHVVGNPPIPPSKRREGGVLAQHRPAWDLTGHLPGGVEKRMVGGEKRGTRCKGWAHHAGHPAIRPGRDLELGEDLHCLAPPVLCKGVVAGAWQPRGRGGPQPGAAGTAIRPRAGEVEESQDKPQGNPGMPAWMRGSLCTLSHSRAGRKKREGRRERGREGGREGGRERERRLRERESRLVQENINPRRKQMRK